MFKRINQTSQGIYIKVSQCITDIYELAETEQTDYIEFVGYNYHDQIGTVNII